MSLNIEFNMAELLKDYNIDDILDDILEGFPKEQRKALFKDLADWCAENIDADIMAEAYRDE